MACKSKTVVNDNGRPQQYNMYAVSGLIGLLVHSYCPCYVATLTSRRHFGLVAEMVSSENMSFQCTFVL